MYLNTIEVDDADELCEIVSRSYIDEGGDYDLTYQQLLPTSSPSRYRCFASEALDRRDEPLADWTFQCSLEEYGNRMEIRGTAPREAWGLLIPIDRAPLHFPTADVRPGDAYLMPPGSEIDVITPAGMRFVDIHCDPISISQKLPWLETDRAPNTGQAVSCPQVRTIAEAIVELLDACETSGAGRPRGFAETRARLFDAVSEIMTNSEKRRPEPPLRLADRRRIARQARDYLEANVDRPLATAEILAETGVPRRSLEVAFRERYGTSPIAFHRLNRLTCVHRELKKGRPEELRVSDSALRHGFSHFGRFATNYKVQFGESPSTTLARVDKFRSSRGAEAR